MRQFWTSSIIKERRVKTIRYFQVTISHSILNFEPPAAASVSGMWLSLSPHMEAALLQGIQQLANFKCSSSAILSVLILYFSSNLSPITSWLPALAHTCTSPDSHTKFLDSFYLICHFWDSGPLFSWPRGFPHGLFLFWNVLGNAAMVSWTSIVSLPRFMIMGKSELFRSVFLPQFPYLQ